MPHVVQSDRGQSGSPNVRGELVAVGVGSDRPANRVDRHKPIRTASALAEGNDEGASHRAFPCRPEGVHERRVHGQGSPPSRRLGGVGVRRYVGNSGAQLGRAVMVGR